MSKNLLEAAQRITEELSLDEKQQLVRKLNQAVWDKQRLQALWKQLDERQKGLPRITMKEIVQEVKAVRRSRAARRRG